MKFAATFALGLAAVSSVVAAPVENELLAGATKLYKRHFPEAKLAKRNNGGSGGSSGGVTDVDILNFALNLEYLEAQFYHIAAYGTQLAQELLGGTGKRGYVQDNPGNQVPFNSTAIKQYAIEIATDETNHVKALRAALGSNAVAMPELNLGTAFTAAAKAAGIITGNATFDPYSSDTNFLLGAFLFEDVGVTAYNGAAPLITSKAYLGAAASILAVEAYHASEIRTVLFALGQMTPALIDAANKAAAVEGAVGGGKSQGIQVNGTANIVPTDENSLAFARTPGQVVDIVTLNAAKKSGVVMGGFFPNGLNGKLNMGAASS